MWFSRTTIRAGHFGGLCTAALAPCECNLVQYVSLSVQGAWALGGHEQAPRNSYSRCCARRVQGVELLLFR